jgi:hypothetical protein
MDGMNCRNPASALGSRRFSKSKKGETMRKFNYGLASVLAVYSCVVAYAAPARPFPEVTGLSLTLGVDDCSATKILEMGVIRSGVNLLERDDLVSWTCAKNRTPPFVDGDLCPYPQDMGNSDATCYANIKGRHPVLCVSAPHVEHIKKYYGDAGWVTDHRARFESLHILSLDGAGRSEHANWVMDEKGCDHDPKKVWGVQYDQCRRLFRAMITGGDIYQFSPGSKFCGGKSADDLASLLAHVNIVRDLQKCLTANPNFYEREAATN